MGGVYNFLVPAALLYSNPGQTIEELSTGLNSAIESDMECDNTMIGLNHFWGRYFNIFSSFCQGRHQVASSVINLELKNRKFNVTPDNDRLGYSGLEILPQRSGKIFVAPRYRIVKFDGERLGSLEDWEGNCLYDPFAKGERGVFNLKSATLVVSDAEKERLQKSEEYAQYFVDDVKKTWSLMPEEVDEMIGGFPDQIVRQQLKVREVMPVYKIEEFDDYDGLVRAYPKYALENLFDLRQNRGELYTLDRDPWRPIHWYKKGDRYYLDIDSMMKHNLERVYTSMVLTAEAIKHNEQEVLGYAGGGEREGIVAQFLKSHPDSCTQHAIAVRHFWHTRDARRRGLTVGEWMRERICEPSNLGLSDETEQLDYQATLDDSPPKIERMMRKREEGIGSITALYSDDDIPF